MARIGIDDADPMTLLALRYFCVVALLLPFCLWVRPTLPAGVQQWAHLAWVGFLIQVVYFGAAWAALDRGINAGTVAVITSLHPILVALIMPAVSDEVVSRRRWLGLALGLGGSLAVIVSGTELALGSGSGLVFAAVALLAFTLGTIWEKRFGIEYHPLVSNTVQYLVGFACTLPLALLLEPVHVTWTVPFALALVYLVVCNSILAITLLLMMIREGQATRVSALFFLVPPVAALIAWVMLGERPGSWAWVGMCVTAAGVFLATRR